MNPNKLPYTKQYLKWVKTYKGEDLRTSQVNAVLKELNGEIHLRDFTPPRLWPIISHVRKWMRKRKRFLQDLRRSGRIRDL